MTQGCRNQRKRKCGRSHFDTQHQAKPAHVFDLARERRLQLAQAVRKDLTDFGGTLRQAFFFQHRQCGQSCRAGQRIA